MDKMYFIVIGLFSIVAPSIWCLVLYILSFTSGWNRLAKSFAIENTPTHFISCSGIFNRASNYNGTIEFALAKDGIFIKTKLLFSIGHKPLFLPWSYIMDFKPQSGLFSKYAYSFNVQGIHISLSTNYPIVKQ